MKNLFDHLFTATEETLKILKKPFIQSRIKRALESASEKAEEIILEQDHKINELLGQEIRKSTDDRVDLDAFLACLENKRKAEQAKKDFAELGDIFFKREVPEEK
jgi:hypothetical protein